MNFFKGKKVLVTGGTGLVGRPLVEMLVDAESQLTVVSLDEPSIVPDGVMFVQKDLREFHNCMELCDGKEIVFHLAGIKGSPAMTERKPASFFVPLLSFNTNMMEAARLCGVRHYLYTSSVGVYSPADIFYEDDVWKTFPSPNDRFAGWAKRMGELQADSYKIEYGWGNISIVRPANIYGPYDNFDPNNAMVIPSLIHRVINDENPLVVWGDGSPIRDFIYSADVARGMMMAVEKGINEPINLGSGTGVSIKQIAETITKNAPGGPIPIKWDTTKPTGDAKRLMDITRAKSYGFEAIVDLEEGIRKTMNWYSKNRNLEDKRYNSFTEYHKP